MSFQLKLQPRGNYSATIAKAQELQLIYSRNNVPRPMSSIRSESDRLDTVEKSLLQVTEQLAALTSHLTVLQPAIRCFNCGRPGHMARNCRSRRMVEYFNCGKTGHVARECQNQGNGQGGAQIPRAGGIPRSR